jgi:hypothetical protein
MIIVIQCAASKRPGAGHLVSVSGKAVDFVANPQAAPPHTSRSSPGPMMSPMTHCHGDMCC